MEKVTMKRFPHDGYLAEDTYYIVKYEDFFGFKPTGLSGTLKECQYWLKENDPNNLYRLFTWKEYHDYFLNKFP